MTSLASDDKRINAGGRNIEHRNQYRRIKGEDVKSASGLAVRAVPLTLNDAANQPISIPFTLPMECLPVARIPEGEDWIYELKLDGYRAQAIRDSKGVRVLSRNGKDLTKKYPQLVKGLNDAIAADSDRAPGSPLM
jgi:ATP-dependent DNA ligase